MENISDLSKDYHHKIDVKVKFHEVDMLSVCNNAVYFNYFEDARIQYLQDLKTKYSLNTVLENGSFFIMAHNECDYLQPALFDDELFVYTKISYIKKSSFGFKHLVINKKTNQLLASGAGTLVHIDFMTKKKIDLPKEFYDAVSAFEKEVELL